MPRACYTWIGVLQLLLEPGEGGPQSLGEPQEHLIHDEHRLLPQVRLGGGHLVQLQVVN